MGTRGTTGFRINETDKISYQQFDSYPSGVGMSVVSELRELLSDIPAFRASVENLKVVKDEKPTEEDIKKLSSFTDLGVSEQSTDDWYCLLRETQGSPKKILQAGYVQDSSEFMHDSLFCEWGYIINLDEEILEVYKGFQRKIYGEGKRRRKKPYCRTVFWRVSSSYDPLL